MPPKDTTRSILDAAEMLFSERGFAETSLRSITMKAGVNLAAVNYHFGSKKSLIQAVVGRFITPFSTQLEQALIAYEEELAGAKPQLNHLLAIVFKTAVVSCSDQPERLNTFPRLLGLAYTQGQGHLKRFLDQEYGHVYRRFSDLLSLATPEISPSERFWRFHFMLGSVLFTFSGAETLKAMAQHDFGNQASTEDVVDLILPFISGGLQASSNTTGEP